MKNLLRAWVCFIAAGGIAVADENPAKHAAKQAGSSRYISEAPLPKGWPEPGPYKQVTRKSYPDYRAAFASSNSPNGGFRVRRRQHDLIYRWSAFDALRTKSDLIKK